MTTLWQIINQIKASKGLGKALGIKPCRGCEKRAQWLNKPVPFLLIAGSGFLLAQAPRKPPSATPAPATQGAAYDTLVVHRLELRDKAGKLRGNIDV